MRINIADNHVRAVVVSFILLLIIDSTLVADRKHVKPKPAKSQQQTEAILPSKNDLSGTVAGLRIVNLSATGAAAKSGLKFGDVLVAYNNHPITTEEEIDAVLRFYQHQQDQTGLPTTAELAFYRNNVMSVKTVQVPIGLLGIDTREWTVAGANVENAIVDGDDYVMAHKFEAEAAASGHYTLDQLLHMRVLCVNDEKTGDKIRQTELDELYRKYPVEKLRLFANYDLLHNKRYRAAAAIFERYLKINRVDVATELSLATCYTELDKFDQAEELLNKMWARPKTDPNAPTEFALSVLSTLKAKIYLGRREYTEAEEGFEAALKTSPNDPYDMLAFLYCAARRDVSGEKSGEFDAAYQIVSAQSDVAVELMEYHVDALRVFVLVKQHRVSLAQKVANKWRDSVEAKRYIQNFWQKFPDGSDVVDAWAALMPQQPIASNRGAR